MELPKELLDIFNWHEISIQKNSQGEAFLILAAPTEEQADFMYRVMSLSRLKLEINISKETKTYIISLVFRYNTEKEIEYQRDTELTSDDYPPLLWLNNGSVKYITTGTQLKENLNQFLYKRPLLHLDCAFFQN